MSPIALLARLLAPLSVTELPFKTNLNVEDGTARTLEGGIEFRVVIDIAIEP